jgi:glycosyltransferase involved in cell wall biosynthesis
MENPDLSVVLLCYRAGQDALVASRQVIEILETEHIVDFELILVANYNDPADLTPHVVAEIAQQDHRVRYTAVKKEGMMGWDMKTGLAMARGNYIAVIDGDGQMPFEDIPRVYTAIKESGADLVKTYRTIRGDDLWRIVVSKIYNFLFWLLFPGITVHDVNSKPKIFSRSALQRLILTSDDWFIDAEIMIQARRYHLAIVEIPTVFKKLVGRQSFIKTNTIIEFLTNLAVYRVKEFYIHRDQ